jgi:hypothetical protein
MPPPSLYAQIDICGIVDFGNKTLTIKRTSY